MTLYILERLKPKIKSSLNQTKFDNREDLEQDLKEKTIRKIKLGDLNQNVPNFFEYTNGKN